MTDLTDLKRIIKLIVRGYPQGKILISELKKHFKRDEGKELQDEVGKFGFDTLTDMIKSWDEDFFVYGNGCSLTVQVLSMDHISEMNKHSK